MKRTTYLVMIFLALSLLISVTLVSASSGLNMGVEPPDWVQDPFPTDWIEETPGSKPPLVGGKQSAAPQKYIQPADDIQKKESVTETTITIWYGDEQNFGKLGNPQQWINIQGNVSTPPGEGIKSLSYVFKGTEYPLEMGPDQRRLYLKGDFNIEIDKKDLDSGENTVTIKAVNTYDVVTQKSVKINYTPGNTWPENFTAQWGSAAKIEDVAQVVTGNWGIKDGKLFTKQVGYDRLVAVGDFGDAASGKWTEYEVTIPITVKALDPDGYGAVSNGPGVGLFIRWQGHTQKDPANPDQPRLDWDRSGALGWYRWKDEAGTQGLEMRDYDRWIGTNTNKVWQVGAEHTYLIKMSVQNLQDPADTRAYYRLKFWKQGQKEPGTWDIEGYSKVNNTPSGSVVLVAHHVDAEFGDVKIQKLDGLTFKLITSVTGDGSVTTDPDADITLFTYGQKAIVRAFPEQDYYLDSWSGDLSVPGTTNPLSVNMTRDMEIIANFKQATPGKLVVNVNPEGSGEVIQAPTEPIGGIYPGGTRVTLTAEPKFGYAFSGWNGALTGNANPDIVLIDGDKQVTANFTKLTEASPISDDFSRCELNTDLWTFVNPTGNGTVKVNAGLLELSVPAGPMHGMTFNNRDAARIMQDTDDEDFTTILKFDSLPTTRFQIEGLLVQQDEDNWLRFDIYHDGNALKMFAGGVIGGTWLSPNFNTSIAADGATSLYMRVVRVGDAWTQTYSTDGSAWKGSQSFNQALSVTSSGILASNQPPSSGADAPAFTAVVDYFRNTAFQAGDSGYLLSYTVDGTGDVNISPEPDASGRYGCNQVVTLEAVPRSSFGFWSGNLSGSQNPAQITMNGDKSVTAHFADGPGPSGFNLFLPTIRRP